MGTPQPPWQRVGKNTRVEPSQEMARLAAEMVSAFHSAQTYNAPPPRRVGRDWSHRKAEWGCSCGQRNFTSKTACRACGAAWSSSCAVFPAGSPPPARNQPQAAIPGQSEGTLPALANAGRVPGPRGVWAGPAAKAGALGHPSKPVALAQTALSAARAAGAPEAALTCLEEEVAKRKAEEIAKQPAAQRLSQATNRANQAQKAHDKAEERLRNAQQAAAEATSSLQAAQKEVAEITAELASAQNFQERSPPPQQALAEILHALLTAVKEGAAAQSPEAQSAARATLDQAATVAERALAPPAPTAESAPVGTEGVQPDAPTQGLKREVPQSQATEVGTMEITDDEAEALLAELEHLAPEAKRSRLASAMRGARCAGTSEASGAA